MSENHEEAIAREIRKALDQLTRELKLTRIAFAAVTESGSSMFCVCV